jgi:hypothetical protein
MLAPRSEPYHASSIATPPHKERKDGAPSTCCEKNRSVCGERFVEGHGFSRAVTSRISTAQPLGFGVPRFEFRETWGTRAAAQP